MRTLPACKDPTAYGRDTLAVVAPLGGPALGFLPCRFLPSVYLRVPLRLPRVTLRWLHITSWREGSLLTRGNGYLTDPQGDP